MILNKRNFSSITEETQSRSPIGEPSRQASEGSTTLDPGKKGFLVDISLKSLPICDDSEANPALQPHIPLLPSRVEHQLHLPQGEMSSK